MTTLDRDCGFRPAAIHRALDGRIIEAVEDPVAIEEPLEIQIGFTGETRLTRTVAVTMRTPGQDRELAAGYLYSERILTEPEDVAAIWAHGNVVRIEIARRGNIDLERLERYGYISSSCGICGKTSLGDLLDLPRVERGESVRADLIGALPDRLRREQAVFNRTGGLHASALFDLDGTLLRVTEDVGRHNALDKLIGTAFLERTLPLSNRVLLLSGRASYELIHKAAAAGIPVVASVGAPSSLAVRAAEVAEITLIGFVRGSGFNIYCGRDRIREAA